MEAIPYAYQILKDIVEAITMSMFKGTKAVIRGENGDVGAKDAVDLSVGVLQGGILAPYLFDIVVYSIYRL